MRTCRSNLGWLVWVGLLAFFSYGQDVKVPPATVKVEVVKARDLIRTAHRFRISTQQLTDARTALREATDLSLHQDLLAPEISNQMGRLWLQLDRKKAREMIGALIARVCTQVQAAEDLATYRKYTSQGQQLLYMLAEIDPEKAAGIIELWPSPAASLGDGGQQALAQFQNDAGSRLTLMQGAGSVSSQALDRYLSPEQSTTLPFTPRIQMVSMLIGTNQKDKARALLDQAIADFRARALDPGKSSDYESFLRGLAQYDSDRFLDAFSIYQSQLSQQENGSNAGVIYEAGGTKVLLNPTESTIMSLIRGLYGKPELTMKLIDANPGLKAKLDQLGGLDNVISPAMLSANPVPRSYPANVPPPVSATTLPGPNSSGRDSGVAPERPISAADLYQTLRGKAEANPEAVQRKLRDTCLKKEHFSALITLAQMAATQDPDLSSIALDVAHGLLPLFDSLPQRGSSLRTLLTTLRLIDGEVDPTLFKEGYILVTEMREDERNRQGQAPAPPAGAPFASDDLEIALIAQNALDDFSAAMRRAGALENETVRIRALLQIAQALTTNY